MRGALAGLILVACSQKLAPLDTSVLPSDADADADADADSDADSDADTDTGPQLDCSSPYTTPAPTGVGGAYPTCVDERLFCGDVVFATTDGGGSFYDYQYWADNQAIGGLVGHPEWVDGPERIYVIEPVPPQSGLTVSIESCNEMWGSWIATGDITAYCDAETQAPKQHFTAVNGGRHDQVGNVLNISAGNYGVQVIVDSAAIGPTPNNYILRVTCD